MNRIALLSDSIKKKIAAGEVIEGPFSAVKELIENSLDAGASEIDVQVADSGLRRISVKDNGCGIFSEDIRLAISEHATSKIRDFHDIEKIMSFGFRGEALSSISSVSEITILTRSPDEDMGSRLYSSSGEIDVSGYAGPAGTTVIVENLFFNIPARKKFLKSRRTELRFIRDIFLNIALSVPGTSFFLGVDGKRHITLPAAGSLQERVKQIFGSEVSDNLSFDFLQDIKVKISGFFSRPGYMKSSRSMQLLYVNGRPVEYRYLGYLLSRAYEGIAIKGKHPAALVFVEIEPELVDVNIHPAKREVKFFDQKYIDGLILSLAGKVLDRKHDAAGRLLNPVNSVSSINKGGDAMHGINTTVQISGNALESILSDPASSAGMSLLRDLPELYHESNPGINGSGYKIMGIVFGAYIVVERGDDLELIDFHAAHERFIYDIIMSLDGTVESQMLIFPVMLELPVDDYHIILEHRGEFMEIGFDIDDFSDNTLMVRAVPEISKGSDVKVMIEDFIESIRQGDVMNGSIREKIAASVACHSARRAGDRLSSDEIRLIAEETAKGNHEARCPHGRPYIHSINKSDLERMFKRQ